MSSVHAAWKSREAWIAAMQRELDKLGLQLRALDDAAVLIERAKADAGGSGLPGPAQPDAASSPPITTPDAAAMPQWPWRAV